jgi:hypothetical protein
MRGATQLSGVSTRQLGRGIPTHNPVAAHQRLAPLSHPDQVDGRQPGQIQSGQHVESGVDLADRLRHIIRKHVRIIKEATDRITRRGIACGATHDCG